MRTIQSQERITVLSETCPEKKNIIAEFSAQEELRRSLVIKGKTPQRVNSLAEPEPSCLKADKRVSIPESTISRQTT